MQSNHDNWQHVIADQLLTQHFARLYPKPYGCKNLCPRHYPDLDSANGKSYFALGRRYCSRCEFTTKSTDKYCKCCGNQFRIKPRSTHVKLKEVFKGY